MSPSQIAVLCGALGLTTTVLQGCGGGGGGGPTPSPSPPPPALIAPDPAKMNYIIPDHTNFHCIKKGTQPASQFAQGYFMYRFASKNEAENQEVDSDNLGDINPYYLLTELMTNSGPLDGSHYPLASKHSGSCHIPKCGEKDDDCVLERIYIEMNNEAAQDVVVHGSIWGQYESVDNGIPSNYPYWAFNWTNSSATCKQDQFSPDCNFYFHGGYPVGCQAKSDVMDTPVWYSTIAGCPQYPFAPDAGYPSPVSPKFDQHHAKLNKADPLVAQCYREMRGGNYCKDEKGNDTSPWTMPSKTCTWQAKRAGYLAIEDIFNVPHPAGKKGQSYHEWCLAQPDNITNYGGLNSTGMTGIPWNLTLFYNLSEIAFPEINTVTGDVWHKAASTDEMQLSNAQKAVFQNWAKWAKVRLNAMFAEMDKQAFAFYNKSKFRDPSNQTYEGCLSNMDVQTPPCKNGIVGSATAKSHATVVV